MGKQVSNDQVREAVVRILEGKGYEVRDVATGSGVPKLSRLEIAKNGKRATCAVKITTYRQGRISFTRNPDGSYKVLSDSDLVIYACPAADDDAAVTISMFDGTTVRRAFDANFEARKGTDQENLPMWLSPKLEAGQRFIGSGFQGDALWSEVAPLSGQADPCASPELSTLSSSDEAKPLGIMKHVKNMLSEHMGVHPDQLEVDVRVKL